MPNEPQPEGMNNDPRSVWQSQPVENTPMPLEELRRRAKQFEKRIGRRNLREYIAGGIVLIVFTVYLFLFKSPMARAGSLLTIAGDLFVMWQLYKRATPLTLPEDLALNASLQFYRRELVRQRDLLRSVWLWYIGPFIPGAVVFGMGVKPKHGAGASPLNALPFFIVLGVVWWLNYRAARMLGRKIGEIEKLEDKS